jgi:hypothetical protein
LIPREVWPDPTAINACLICTSFPAGLKVVREKEYWLSPMVYCLKTQRGKTDNASVWERKGYYLGALTLLFLLEKKVFSYEGFYNGFCFKRRMSQNFVF